MKPISQYISAMLATLLGVVICGCSSHSDSPSAASKMSISFRVETRNGGETNAGEETSDPTSGYEEATDWENYIDIENDNYCIAFFDKNNRCISPFTAGTPSVIEGTNYKEYTLEGEVPGILTRYSDFKIVVLANWDQYPEIKAELTTIDNLCCPNEGRLGQFAHFGNLDYQIEEGQRYVPMYGVKEYTGVVFGKDEEGNPAIISQGNFGPVNMLRAIAKVELEFDTDDDFELDETKGIYITNYNAYGYCAPEGAYTESDYNKNNWNQDYWQGHLHLVGGQNDTGDEKPLSMRKMRKDGKDIWVAYLPEYRNKALTGSEKDCKNSGIGASSESAIRKARIAVPHIQGESSRTSYVEFATYTDGEAGNPINIERNNLYRFTIIGVDKILKWEVEAEPWNGYEHETIVM